MVTLKLTESDLSSILHCIDMTPLIERPQRKTITKLRNAYMEESGEDAYEEWPDLHPEATGL